MILCISVLSAVMSPFSFIILLVWVLSFPLISLAMSLSILFIFLCTGPGGEEGGQCVALSLTFHCVCLRLCGAGGASARVLGFSQCYLVLE